MKHGAFSHKEVGKILYFICIPQNLYIPTYTDKIKDHHKYTKFFIGKSLYKKLLNQSLHVQAK